ncbi:unnamed protein product [Aphanomyces euteiches]|uniref:CBM1 domain-containing protein n=1 Tax=Aphanomyces euteiches TaxID=100861 RepID=A0A6G0XDQ6_9STRA|nr:hypothetical protein Ae201684_005796 [Aphanomyces euteiches]KAH9078514.1 hypothetical protein Ae201684P_019598 [Aphanomyces euteiches]KAH9140855.1 hypothetical protein AeRB84_014933 [Aphanomyces euteiches]
MKWFYRSLLTLTALLLFCALVDAESPCKTVRVQGDATYCVFSTPCGRNSDQAGGLACPRRNDEAVADCVNGLQSYDNKTTICTAPEDATCNLLPSGEWGCVWESAATPNQLRGYWRQDYCADDYENCKGAEASSAPCCKSLSFICTPKNANTSICEPRRSNAEAPKWSNQGDFSGCLNHNQCEKGYYCRAYGIGGVFATCVSMYDNGGDPGGYGSLCTINGDCQNRFCSRNVRGTFAYCQPRRKGKYAVCKWDTECMEGKSCIANDLGTFSDCQPTPTDGGQPVESSVSWPTKKEIEVESWQQCGGVDYRGDKTCTPGNTCVKINEFYSQCQPDLNQPGLPTWSQCGGHGYNGETECRQEDKCKAWNSFYSQCVPRLDD